ncbi:MAG: hypothetical protein WBA67_11560, partial [Jannaschia sp.]
MPRLRPAAMISAVAASDRLPCNISRSSGTASAIRGTTSSTVNRRAQLTVVMFTFPPAASLRTMVES